MIVSAVRITDSQKKNELILFASSLGCKAVYSDKYEGLCIETVNRRTTKEIEQKIKELENK